MRDEFPARIRETLGKRTGGRCSNPSCPALTSGPHTDPLRSTSVGVAAHITAAAPGGPRYETTLTPNERAAIDNAIWLCQRCATLIDRDPDQFSTETLRAWKRGAEGTAYLALLQGAAPGAVNLPDVGQLLTEYFPDEILQAGLLTKTLAARTDADKHHIWTATITPEGTTVTLLPKDPHAPPITVRFDPIFQDTVADKEREAAWTSFRERGTPVELTQENAPRHTLPEAVRQTLPPTGDYVLRLGSRPKGKLIMSMTTTASDGATHTIPYIEMQVLRAGNREVLICNEEQPIPFKFTIHLDKNGKATETWEFKLAGAGIHWLDEVRRFVKAMQPGATTVLRDIKTGRAYPSTVTRAAAPAPQFSKEFERFIDRALAIQALVNAEITIPSRPYPSEEDLHALETMEECLANGTLPYIVESFTITIEPTPEGRTACAAFLDGAPVTEEEPFSVSFLDCTVPLGIAHLSGTGVIHPDDLSLAKALIDGTIIEPMRFRIVPREQDGFAMSLSL